MTEKRQDLQSNTYYRTVPQTSVGITLKKEDSGVDLGGRDRKIIISNLGESNVFITAGKTQPTAVFPTNSETASTEGQIVPSGVMIEFSLRANVSYLAAISDYGSNDIAVSIID